MTEAVFSCADLPTLVAAAESMGFWRAAQGLQAATFIFQGPVPGDPNYQASFFLNVVGVVEQPTGNTITDRFGNPAPEMAAIPGYWGRLRVNGLDPVQRGLITIPSSMTVYRLVTPADGVTPPFWSADGVTPAPYDIANIGVIA